MVSCFWAMAAANPALSAVARRLALFSGLQYDAVVVVDQDVGVCAVQFYGSDDRHGANNGVDFGKFWVAQSVLQFLDYFVHVIGDFGIQVGFGGRRLHREFRRRESDREMTGLGRGMVLIVIGHPDE